MGKTSPAPHVQTAGTSLSRNIGVAVTIVFFCTIPIVMGCFLLFSRAGYERALRDESNRIGNSLTDSLSPHVGRGNTMVVSTIGTVFCQNNSVSALYVQNARKQTIFEFHEPSKSEPATMVAVDRDLVAEGTTVGTIHVLVHDRALQHRLGEIGSSIILTGLAIILAVLIALHFIVIKQLSRPLSILLAQTKEYERGNFADIPYDRNDIAVEFRPLAQSLQSIGKSLALNTERLHRIAEEQETLLKEQFNRMNRSVTLMGILVEREREFSQTCVALDRLQKRVALIPVIYGEFMTTLSSGRIDMDRLVRTVIRREHQVESGMENRPLTFDFESFTLPFEKAIPLGLLIQELTGILLRERTGGIDVRLRKREDSAQLSILDKPADSDSRARQPLESPWADRLAREFSMGLSHDGGFTVTIPPSMYE